MIVFWLLLALVIWAASVAGVQLLQPPTLIRYLERAEWAWWAGQVVVPLAQLASLALLMRMPFERPALAVMTSRSWSTAATWLGVIAWWSFPWQGESQWLRCAPREAVWVVFVLIGLTVTVPIRVRVLSLCAAVALLPSSLPGCAAALAWTSVGSLRAVSALLAYVGAVSFYRPPSALELGWAALAMLLLALRRGEPQMGALLVFSLFNAALGAPSLANIAAVGAATLASMWQRSRFWELRPFWATRYPLLLVATGALLIPGVLRLSRGLVGPWRESRVSLFDALLPHSPRWWTDRLGSRWDFGAEDLEAAEWLAGQPEGPGLVVSTDRAREPRWVADLYRHFSKGRAGAGWSGGTYTVEAIAIKQTLRPDGSGLRWLIVRGRSATAANLPTPTFQAGEVRVLPLVADAPKAGNVFDLKVGERSGPGGTWGVELWGDGPAVAAGPPPRLVLSPGLNRLRMPEKQDPRVFDFGGRLLSLPAFDLPAQLRQVRVAGGYPVSVAGRSGNQLLLRLRNSSQQPLELSALGGARLVFAGDRAQMVQELPGSVPPGGETEVSVNVPPDALGRGVDAHVWLVDRAGVEYWVGSVPVSAAVREVSVPAESLPTP